MIEAAFGLVGVVIGSAITIARETWASSRERRRDGSYSAIRLICMLEEYSDKCIDVVYDDGTAYGRPAGRTKDGEEYREAQAVAPEPLDFPDDIGWRAIPEPLMHRALALPNKARSTDRHIQVASDFASPPDYEEFFRLRQKGYAQLGLEALEIAGDLRHHFRVSSKSRADLNADWNPVVFLRKRLAE